MVTLPPPLSASRDPFDSIVQLICVLATIVTTVITYVLESRLNPRPRFLISGEAAQHRQSTQTKRPTTNSDPFEPGPNPSVEPEPSPKPSEEPESGTNTSVEREPESLQQTRRTPKRARACLAFIRLTIVAAIAASLAFATLDVIKYLTASAYSPLASRRTNEWMQAVMHRAVLTAGANMSREQAAFLASPNIRVGLGERAITPDAKNALRFFWAAFMFLVGVVGIIGAFLAVAAEVLPMKKAVALLMTVQSVFWLIAALIAANVGNTKLPVDASGLMNHWTDGLYNSEPNFINETRMVGNWYVSVPTQSGENIVPLLDLDYIQDAFCEQFMDLLPKTGAEVQENESEGTRPPTTTATSTTEATTTTVTEEEPDEESDDPPSDPPPADPDSGGDDRPTPDRRLLFKRSVFGTSQRQDEDEDDDEVGHPNLPNASSVTVPQLTRSNADEIFVVYLVGKPIGGLDRYRLLSYFGLAGLIGAPVIVAQFCRAWFLYPVVAMWAVVWGAFALLGTPTVLRVLTLPTDRRQTFRVCDTDYHVLVMDSMTKSVARIDAAVFGLVLFTAILHGFRWAYFAEKRAVEEDEKEVKLINYEDVFSRNGSLRW